MVSGRYFSKLSFMINLADRYERAYTIDLMLGEKLRKELERKYRAIKVSLWLFN